MLDGAYAEMKWGCVHVISGDGRLDGMWMQSDARGRLVCGMRMSVAVSGVHDVMYSGGEVWNGESGCLVSYGSVCCGGVGAVPRAMVIKVGNRGKG